jgi:hypothetical protein
LVGSFDFANEGSAPDDCRVRHEHRLPVPNKLIACCAIEPIDSKVDLVLEDGHGIAYDARFSVRHRRRLWWRARDPARHREDHCTYRAALRHPVHDGVAPMGFTAAND